MAATIVFRFSDTRQKLHAETIAEVRPPWASLQWADGVGWVFSITSDADPVLAFRTL